MISSRAFRLIHDDFLAMLRRRAAELIGLGIVTFGLALLVALATWSVQDPSLSHATDLRTKNWLGYPGAIASDFLMQLFGIAAIAVVLPIGVLGWQIVTHRPVYHLRFRVLTWLLGVSFSAAAAACLPVTSGWPLPASLGGVLGDAIMSLPLWLFGTYFAAEVSIVFGVTFAVFASIALALACGIGLAEPEEIEEHEEEEEEFEEDEDVEEPRHGFLSLGALIHGFLAIKARLAGHGAPLRDTLQEVFGRDRDEIPLAPRREPVLSGTRGGNEQDYDEAEEEYEEEEEDEDEEEERPKRAAPRRKAARARRGRWEYPPLDVLAAAPKSAAPALSQAALEENARRLEGVLKDFGVQGEIVNVRPGPVVTLYELEPAPGIKSSRVIGLADDIARSMSAVSARVAVVPGRNAIGIELPNPRRDKVVLREMLPQPAFRSSWARISPGIR